MCYDQDANNILSTQQPPAEEKKEKTIDGGEDGKDEVGKYLFQHIFEVVERAFARALHVLPMIIVLTSNIVDDTNGEYLKPNWD